MSPDALRAQLAETRPSSPLPGMPAPSREGVRDAYAMPERRTRVVVYSDRIPATEETAPFRGEIAAALAAAALARASAFVPHALLDRPDPCVLLFRALEPSPLRVRFEGSGIVRTAEPDSARRELDALAAAETFVLAELARLARAGIELREACVVFGRDAGGRLLVADDALTPDTTRVVFRGVEFDFGLARLPRRLLRTRRRLDQARAMLELANAWEGSAPELHPGPVEARIIRNLRRAGIADT